LQEKFSGKPVFSSTYRVAELVRQEKGGHRVQVDREVFDEQRCFAFCGIARPESFRQTLEEFAIDLVGFQALADHHCYHKKEVRQLLHRAEKKGADCLLCTEKDLVKLRDVNLGLPLYALTMEVDPDPALNQFVLSHVLRSAG
jgi:tetraacyldisaccharide 4'-kinase